MRLELLLLGRRLVVELGRQEEGADDETAYLGGGGTAGSFEVAPVEECLDDAEASGPLGLGFAHTKGRQ